MQTFPSPLPFAVTRVGVICVSKQRFGQGLGRWLLSPAPGAGGEGFGQVNPKKSVWHRLGSLIPGWGRGQGAEPFVLGEELEPLLEKRDSVHGSV